MVALPDNRVLVLDDGTPVGADLVDRMVALMPDRALVLRKRGASDHPGAQVVRDVGSSSFDLGRAVAVAHDLGTSWIAVPRGLDESMSMVVDLVSATARHCGDGHPGYAVLFSDEGREYARAAVVADVRDMITTGLLALAAVGVARRTGASLDILMLGADPDNTSQDWREAVASLTTVEGAEYLESAIKLGIEAGLEVKVVPLPTAPGPQRGRTLLEVVRSGGYDVVLDDLRPMGISTPIGRRAQIKASLTSNDDPDTAYLLLTKAPCDVVVVVDAVRLGVLPADALRAGAAGALALGVVGTGMIAAAPATPAGTVAAADSQPAESGSGELTDAQKIELQAQLETAKQQLQAQQEKEAEARAVLQQAKQARAQARNAALQGREVLKTGMDWDATGQLPTVAVAGAAKSSPDTGTVGAQTGGAKSGKAALAKATSSKNPTAKKKTATAANRAKKQAVAKKRATSKKTATAANRAKKQAVAKKRATSKKTATPKADADASHLVTQESGSVAAQVTEQAQQAHARKHKAAAQSHVQRGRELLRSGSVKATLSKAARSKAKQDLAQARAAQRQLDKQIRTLDQKLSIRVEPTQNYTITAVFGQPGSYWSLGYHTGLDYAAPAGTPIFAADQGTVVQAGWGGAYGNYTVIEHENGVTTHYATPTLAGGQSWPEGEGR